MTRFARAKGSKASNQKTPEDSTPWEVMKEQIIKSKKETEEAKHRQEAEQQRIENYTNFLKEQKVQKRKATWCDFPEDKSVTKSNTSDECNSTSNKKKKKNKQNNSNNMLKNEQHDDQSKVDVQATKELKKKKKNKSVQNQTQPNDMKVATQSENVEHAEKTNDNTEQVSNGHQLKKKNKKKKSEPYNKENMKQSHDKTAGNTAKNVQEEINKVNTSDSGENKKKNKIKNLKKKNNNEPVRRKEINDRSFQLIINGKEIELIRFDGFPIMKKDAERLEELKTSMIKKGIPKTEVQRTMKLERRRAEKALARLKREVCYNCRKGGHNLSDCPDLKSKIPGVDSAEGVCFKCGSTEHRQFECKVQRDKEFRFATCFICKESGHIARQCPDNPKGLYPNGGCCKLCGDVTHLKKDCPTIFLKRQSDETSKSCASWKESCLPITTQYHTERLLGSVLRSSPRDTNSMREETSIKLQTLDSTENIEDINLKVERTSKEEGMKKPKKIRF